MSSAVDPGDRISDSRTRAGSGTSWAELVRRFPLPFIAIAGLGVGASIRYLAGLPAIGDAVWLGTVVVGGLPLVYQTVRRVIRGEFASDVIAAFAIVGALALDEPFAGVIIVLMQSGGQALDSYAFHRASSSLDALLRRAPRIAHRRTNGDLEEVPVDRVRPGDLLQVRTGDLIPVDGAIVDRDALLDESSLTGEPLPQRRAAGETVLSGVVNVGPPFQLRAVRPSGESQYAQIVALVRSAQERKPQIQRLADRYAVWFTPLSLAVAAVAWALSSNPTDALAVLVVATPCPLIIATPIAVIGGVNRAADRGIIVKTGGAIEEIGRARVVVFDKTGTLTSGQPEVERVVPFGSRFDAEELIRLAAPLEQLSSHPLGAAVVRWAGARGLPVLPADEAEEVPGAGVEGTVEGHRVLVGSARLLRSRLGPERWAGGSLPSGIDLHGRMVGYVAVDGVPEGAILFGDRVRPGVAPLIARLRKVGVRRVAMLTGDGEANAREIARAAGITDYLAELSPQGKVEAVGRYRRSEGSTVMVGDGINDAAALAAASVGVAMGARGAGVSAEAADVVLLVDDVTRVADGVELGQRMVRIARQGIVFGLGASLVLMAIAASGHVLPALGAVLQEAIDVAVIANALRVR